MSFNNLFMQKFLGNYGRICSIWPRNWHGILSYIKNNLEIFSRKKRIFNWSHFMCFGLCPFVFTSIADAVINPEGLPANEDGIFVQEKIAIKMKTFSLIMFITMGACGLLSQILMFPLDNIVSTDNNQVVVEEDNDKKVDAKESYASNEIFNNENEAPLPTDNNEPPVIAKEEEKKTIYVQEPFMQAFKSLRFHLFNFMSVGTLCK
jgi:hypothetical protein